MIPYPEEVKMAGIERQLKLYGKCECIYPQISEDDWCDGCRLPLGKCECPKLIENLEGIVDTLHKLIRKLKQERLNNA